MSAYVQPFDLDNAEYLTEFGAECGVVANSALHHHPHLQGFRAPESHHQCL
jgi:hypothetical protein